MTEKQITAEEFDRKFDDGGNISEYIDWEKARRPGREADVARMIQQLQETKARLLEEARRIDETLKALHHA